MFGLVFVLLMFMGVVTLGFTALSYYHETQRIEQLRFVAERMGFSYWPEADPDLAERLGSFHLFSQGHSGKIEHVLRRQIHDIVVTLFEYSYRTNNGRHTRAHHQTVLLFETERLQLPLFILRPAGTLHRIGGEFGSQDITFENHPVFSKHYSLRGAKKGLIRERFTEEVLCYYSRHDGLYTEGAGQRLLFYQRDQMVEPGWLESFLERGLDVLGLFMKREGTVGVTPFLGLGLEGMQADAAPEPAGTADETLHQLEAVHLE